jgi:hypothetical protein
MSDNNTQGMKESEVCNAIGWVLNSIGLYCWIYLYISFWTN